MKKLFTLFLALTSFLFTVDGQTLGDYRSFGNGNWGTNTTWQRFDGANWVAAGTAPTSADGTITIRSPHLVIANTAVSGDQVVVETGGNLTITSTLTLNDGPGTDLSVHGLMNFQNTLAGAGSVVIENSGTLLLTTAAVKQTTANVIITNNGTMTWDEGGFNFSGAVVNNNIFNITANALWQFSGGLTNTGTINKTSGATNISTPWSNSGTINISGGSITNSSSFTNTGSIIFSSGGAWQNSIVFNHNPGSVISGTGTFNNSGTLSLAIDQVFSSTLIFSNSGTINGVGALTINNDFVIQGNITGGAMTLNGNGDWQGGSLGRSLTIDVGRTLLLSTGTVKTFNDGSTLTNNGTLTWEAGGLNFGGAVINNNVFNISASALWQFSGGLTNSGTINKTSGTTNISTTWSNSGTINLSGGTLTSSGVFTNTGSILFSSGAAWQNSSTFNHNTGSVVTGTGSFNNGGTLALAIDQVFPSTLIFSSSGTINGVGALTINNDFVIQGSITGGPMTLNGNGEWTGGSLGRSLTMETGRTLLLSTGTVKTLNDGATLTNNGTLTWQEGGLNFGGAVINNSVFNIAATALWQFSGGFTNTGTINKTSGATTINTPWSNSGTINVSGGTLTSSGAFTNTGSITFSSGAVWQNNSTFNHNTGSVVTGTGSFSNGGTLTLNISQVFPPTLIFANTNIINGPGDLTINNDFIILGNITGGVMTLNGNGEWTGGSLGRSLTIEAGRTLLLSTATVKTYNSGATLTNNGTLIWQEGGLNFGGAVINNNVFNIAATALWQFSGGLTNTGTINKTSGATNISTPWSNSGTINVSGGTLTSSGVFTNTGSIIFSSGATWQNNSTFNHNTGSVISGTGNFNNGGTLTLNISQVFASTLIFANTNFINGPGALTINNDFIIQGSITGGALILNGNGDWLSGVLSRSLTIDAGRTLLLSTGSVKTFGDGATLTNNGTLTWQEGGLNFGGAVINNNVFNINASALWQFGGGLTNNGLINKNNTGAINLNTPVTNASTGTIRGVGTITFSTTFTSSGTLAPGLTIGQITMNGTTPLTSTGTLQVEMFDGSGPGTGHDQLLRNGNLILNGTLTVTETGTVPDGIYTIIDLSSGVISGSFTTINLPPGYTFQVYTDNVRIAKNVPLSLTLLSFTGREARDQNINLEWVSTDEQNVSHFEIQRSSDGIHYTGIANITALNNPKGGTYHYLDESPFSKNNYYRLNMVDTDASAKLSPVIMVKLTDNGEVNVYPTVTNDQVFIYTDESITVQLFCLSNALLLQKQITGHDYVDLANLANGIYVLVLNEKGKSIKILKQ